MALCNFTKPAYVRVEQTMMEVMRQCLKEAQQKWDRQMAGGSVQLEMFECLSLLAMDMIGRTSFGSRARDEKGRQELEEALHLFMRHLPDKMDALMQGGFLPLVK